MVVIRVQPVMWKVLSTRFCHKVISLGCSKDGTSDTNGSEDFYFNSVWKRECRFLQRGTNTLGRVAEMRNVKLWV